MARTISYKNRLLIDALIAKDGGAFTLRVAKNITCGSSRMDNLQKAIKMENNYHISCYTWIKLYKKRKEDLLENRVEEVYQLQHRREKSSLENDFLLEALLSKRGGRYSEAAAKNIIYGAKAMNSLERALRMEQNFDIAPCVWLKLVK